jgi:TM2 domain-containing membrane protein YozV
MPMKKLVFAFLTVFALGSVNLQAMETDNFFIDDSSVELLFEQAKEEVTIKQDFFSVYDFTKQEKISGGDNPIIAFVLAWFIGFLGIHRAYMGTNAAVVIGYILTIGGCGIVVLVDWIVLLIGVINNDISKYVDNTKFFMW